MWIPVWVCLGDCSFLGFPILLFSFALSRLRNLEPIGFTIDLDDFPILNKTVNHGSHAR